ncbi:ferric reductase NAD binding domain-domain-containing protein [Leucosporidium creatinivorum]|uniref:Ferric reductase NAD binding domain-domain-containing protein n=1 Tax=Leucosporidium creatinivorum TaxID=106004 RepID=A0A1Y2F2G3_9BASI|nr:ferric reductase NAD binding domain-domain-containing protein [Leucosporidium creatinivorum]
MSPLLASSAGRKAYTPRPIGLTPAIPHHTRSLSPSLSQKALSRRIILLYNLVLLAFVLLLTLRHLVLIVQRRRRSRMVKKEIAEEVERSVKSLEEKKAGWWGEEKEVEIEVKSVKRREGACCRMERWATGQLEDKWYWCGLENPLQVGIFLGLFALNVGFTLWGTVIYVGEHTSSNNPIHSAALRAGYLSVANLPLLIAMTGRNGVVQFLTGIEYQHLRFVHKLMAIWMALFAVIHTVDASVAETQWFGGAGVASMYLHTYLGQTGLAMIAGLLCILLFSLRAVRNRFYELFIVTHVVGAILILVGLFYHIPALRPWVWAPIAIWAFERTARLLQFLSIHLLTRFNLRSPLRKANATLVDGAIILRVPFKGAWGSGQHAYLSFPGMALGQSHPFSIANVPSDFNATEEKDTHEMLFVLGVRGGVTATIAKYLEGFSSKSAELMVGVEGPYGGDSKVQHYEDILFVGGGTGITHLSSMMADAVQKATKSKSCTTRIKLIWVIQSVGQSSWIISDLLDIVAKAQDARVAISLDFHITRGPLNAFSSSSNFSSCLPTRNNSVADLDELPNRAPNRNNSVDSMASFESFQSLDSLYHPRPNFWAHSRRPSAVCETHLDLLLDAGAAAAMHKGRPKLPQAIASFVESAGKSTLVVVCGPPKMAKEVASESAKLSVLHPVTVQAAVFEC